MTLLIRVRGVSKQVCPGFLIPYTVSPSSLSFAYLMFCWETSLHKKLDLADPNK
jgi:hypothetical protein